MALCHFKLVFHSRWGGVTDLIYFYLMFHLALNRNLFARGRLLSVLIVRFVSFINTIFIFIQQFTARGKILAD